MKENCPFDKYPKFEEVPTILDQVRTVAFGELQSSNLDCFIIKSQRDKIVYSNTRITVDN